MLATRWLPQRLYSARSLVPCFRSSYLPPNAILHGAPLDLDFLRICPLPTADRHSFIVAAGWGSYNFDHLSGSAPLLMPPVRMPL